MSRQNNPNWRGKCQPKREPCPNCEKRGLGPIKLIELTQGRSIVGQHCRYCHWIVRAAR